MRAAMGFIGFVFAALGACVALALDSIAVDTAGGWMLAAAGVALCAVSVWPRHDGSIARRRARWQVP